jgi:hypothetical protein
MRCFISYLVQKFALCPIMLIYLVLFSNRLYPADLPLLRYECSAISFVYGGTSADLPDLNPLGQASLELSSMDGPISLSQLFLESENSFFFEPRGFSPDWGSGHALFTIPRV